LHDFSVPPASEEDLIHLALEKYHNAVPKVPNVSVIVFIYEYSFSIARPSTPEAARSEKASTSKIVQNGPRR
jgi:hypothetical protein